MNKPATTLSHSGTKFFTTPEGNDRRLYFGIRITLTQRFESVNAVVQFIQDVFYDEIGTSGNFWLMPESYKDAITENFNGTIETDLAKAVEFNEDNTVVDLLLCTEDYESLDEEINAFALDLTELVLRKFATKYEQFWLY